MPLRTTNSGGVGNSTIILLLSKWSRKLLRQKPKSYRYESIEVFGQTKESIWVEIDAETEVNIIIYTKVK